MIPNIIQWPEDFFWSNRLQVAVWYQPNREMTILSCFIALHNKNNMMLIKLDHRPGGNRTQQNIGTTYSPTFSQPSSSPSSSTSPSSLRARFLFYTIIESTHLIRFSNVTGNNLILLDCKIFSQDMTTLSSYPNWSLFIQKLLNQRQSIELNISSSFDQNAPAEEKDAINVMPSLMMQLRSFVANANAVSVEISVEVNF